ncbi:hypothetical protein ACVXKK_28320, partial [Klebsiella pneumoniae]
KRNNRAALGQCPGSSSRNTITISLSCFVATETPSRWEKLVINDDTLTTRMQTPDQLNLKLDDVNFYSPRHPPIGRMSMD